MENNKINKYYNISIILIGIAILLLFFIEFILNITPPVARDVLIHHLAIPKLWLKNGGFYEIKWADFSYYPMNIDLLYIIPLYFNNDTIPSFIHVGFGIGTAWLIYHYLSNKLGRLAGLLGVFVFLSTPIVVRMSTVAYVDLGLVFFTTASLLAYIRWRDGKYKAYKWFFLSAIAMGLALGTKYNALIAWFFLSLAIVFVYSRDTERQWKAIGYGAIFFLVSLFVFSPWLTKNIILTGNPLYPLFKGIFNISSATSEGGTHSIVSGDTYMGIFKMREMLYGENFWETLLIPIRLFFQGQDNSDRYFEGVLNPILIIIVPFAFMNKSFYRDKLFFMFFTIFFILTAFFLDELRVRYILPVVPVLSILTVMGLINIFNWTMSISNRLRNLLVVVLFSIFIIIMGRNILYINNYFQNIRPMSYILNKESRDEFITRHDHSYSAIKYINTHTPENAKVRLVLLAGRGYYLDRVYEDDSSYGMDVIRGLAASSNDDKSFRAYLHSLGCTHLLVRVDLFHQFLRDNYSSDTANRLFRQMRNTMNTIYNSNGYSVMEITSFSSRN
jgi:4-amino-4-deoxy-L-arabinose transferase-like glycosyltransferase